MSNCCRGLSHKNNFCWRYSSPSNAVWCYCYSCYWCFGKVFYCEIMRWIKWGDSHRWLQIVTDCSQKSTKNSKRKWRNNRKSPTCIWIYQWLLTCDVARKDIHSNSCHFQIANQHHEICSNHNHHNLLCDWNQYCRWPLCWTVSDQPENNPINQNK